MEARYRLGELITYALVIAATSACGAVTELDGKDASPAFCASLTLTPLFCDDFEDGTLAKWTSSIASRGSIDISSEGAVSPPFALGTRVLDGMAAATMTKSFKGKTGSTT